MIINSNNNSNTTATERPPFRVLVTGFGPYGDTQLNPSLAVVQELQKSPKKKDGGMEILAHQVSSEFDTCIAEATALMDLHRPDAVLCMGEYPGRSQVTLERVAINYQDATRYGVADQANQAPQGTPVVKDGPLAYPSTLPLRRCVRDLRERARIPSDISDNAGTLMCNHLLYGVLHHAATAKTSGDNNSTPPLFCGWIHLPALPEQACLERNILQNMPSMSTETSTRAVRQVMASLKDHAEYQRQQVKGTDVAPKDLDIPIRSRLLV